MDGGGVDWTDLPPQLYPLISKHLKTRIEILRFRTVCITWRTFIPPFHASVPLKFPVPLSDGPAGFLSQITVYLLRPVPGLNPNASTSSSSSSTSASSSKGGWLLKLEECSDKLRLLNPITSWRIRHLNDDASINSAELNLLDFNMVELTKTYVLRYTNGSGSIFGMNKVIVAPPNFDYSIFIIYNEGKLGFSQNGNEKLTLINDQVSDYDDLIVFKGQPYVVDKWGQIFHIDSSLKLVIFSPSIGFGHRKNLIECCGELYVVDRYLDHQDSNSQLEVPILGRRGRRRFYECGQSKAVDFRVYKLLDDEGLGGRRWVEVKSLGDQAFFLSIDACFSVLATELEGCKGNRIYFTDSNDIGLALRGLIRPDGSVFSLEDHSIERLGSSPFYSKMFWPLPTQLSSRPD